MKYQFDAEEKEILTAYENKDLSSVENVGKEKQTAREAAVQTLSKSKHISIRLSEHDVAKIKAKAIQSGVSYQSIISALVHQYANGTIQLVI